MAAQKKGSPASRVWQWGWRGLCKAGDKGFGTQTAVVSSAGASEEDQVRSWECGAGESPIAGGSTHTCKLHSVHFHPLSDPKYCTSDEWTRQWEIILSLCFHIGEPIPFSAAAAPCFLGPQIHRYT